MSLQTTTLQSQEPIRTTELQYDELGRLVAQKTYDKEHSQSTQYHYDKFSRIKQVNDEQSSLVFTYDKLGRLQQQTSKHEDITQALIYAYDANHNRLQTQLPDGNVIKYAYKGTGSLHTIDFNDTRITEFTRNIMQREIGRTQGKLTTTFNRDPLIRMATQVAQADGASPVIKRDYIYDATGNLIRCHDIRSGVTNYQYDSLGQISQVTTPIGEEIFAFDPAHNIVEHYTHKVENNRLEQYHGVQYRYDEFGNVIQKTTQTGEQQHYTYNLKDQLITATMSKPNQETEVWHYEYDVLGRRIAKYRENATDKNNADKNNGQNSERTEFIWDGSHLVQEINPQGTYTYIYSHPSSYEPLAQIHENKENKQSIAYFHTDQIGIPREMTDDNGQLLWNGTYTAWGQLKEENNPHNTHQPLRLQNQYYDRETGLHYNFFRYYDTHCGRFITQDPIKLQGGNNFYQFAPNTQGWSDPLGLDGYSPMGMWNRMAQPVDIFPKDGPVSQYISSVGDKFREGFYGGGEAGGTAGLIAVVKVSTGVVVDKSTFQICSVSTICGGAGLYAGVSTNALGYVSSGTLTPGSVSWSFTALGEITAGGGGGFTGAIGTDGSLAGGYEGNMGVAAGGAILLCRSEVSKKCAFQDK